MILIMFNAVLIGLESYPAVYEKYHSWIDALDLVILWAFTLEIALRLMSSRPWLGFFRNGWNVFDFVIVLSGHLFVGASFITVLRVVRILRVLRTISLIPSLRRIVNALLLTIPSLGNITLLLSILFYIFAVSGTIMFRNASPEYFGTLHDSLLTLFQVVTLEAWASEVMRPIMDTLPWAWVYFVLFILLGTFIVMNLIVGVIVANLDKAHSAEEPSGTAEPDHSSEQIAALRADIAELKKLVKQLSANK